MDSNNILEIRRVIEMTKKDKELIINRIRQETKYKLYRTEKKKEIESYRSNINNQIKES